MIDKIASRYLYLFVELHSHWKRISPGPDTSWDPPKSLRLWSYVASLSDSNGRRQGVERGSLDDSTWREQDSRDMKVGRVLQSGAWAGLWRQLIVKRRAIMKYFI